MFGRKSKAIKALNESVIHLKKIYVEELDAKCVAQNHCAVENTRANNLDAQLQYSVEENQKLNEFNFQLETRNELLQQVLKQLSIPVKLPKKG
jgi:hypothetical protein